MACPTDNFLIKSCNLFENSTDEFHRIIYTQLRQKRLELKEPSSEPNGLIDKKLACRWCCSSWASGQYSLRLAPQKRPQRYKQLLRKLSGDFSKLPKHRLKFAASNFMILKCYTCWQTTKIPLTKPTAESFRKNESKPEDETSSQSKKKKRKRKKDDLAGLNPDAVKRSKLSNSLGPSTSSSSNASSTTFASKAPNPPSSLATLYRRSASPQRPPVVKTQVEPSSSSSDKPQKSLQNKRTMKEVNDKPKAPSSCSTTTKRIPQSKTSDLIARALTQNQKKRRKKSNKLKSPNVKKNAKSSVAEFISSI